MTKRTCKLIDSEMTLHGMRFRMDGCREERFHNNAPILYMHVRGNVYGQWENFRREGDAYYADYSFDMEDPDAAKLAGKVERGIVKAVSLGAKPHQVEMIDGELWVTDWEPIEASFVDTGSSKNALKLYSTEIDLIEDEKQYVELQLSIMTKEATKVPTVPELPKTIALAAGLDENADTDAVEAKIKAVLKENADLKLAAVAGKKQAIKDLLDQAEADKKITPAQRPHYETLAAADFDAVKNIVGGLVVPFNLVDFTKGGNATAPASKEIELAAEWDQLDQAGGDTLYNLSVSSPDRWRELYKAKFGVYPK